MWCWPFAHTHARLCNVLNRRRRTFFSIRHKERKKETWHTTVDISLTGRSVRRVVGCYKLVICLFLNLTFHCSVLDITWTSLPFLSFLSFFFSLPQWHSHTTDLMIIFSYAQDVLLSFLFFLYQLCWCQVITDFLNWNEKNNIPISKRVGFLFFFFFFFLKRGADWKKFRCQSYADVVYVVSCLGFLDHISVTGAQMEMVHNRCESGVEEITAWNGERKREREREPRGKKTRNLHMYLFCLSFMAFHASQALNVVGRSVGRSVGAAAAAAAVAAESWTSLNLRQQNLITLLFIAPMSMQRNAAQRKAMFSILDGWMDKNQRSSNVQIFTTHTQNPGGIVYTTWSFLASSMDRYFRFN